MSDAMVNNTSMWQVALAVVVILGIMVSYAVIVVSDLEIDDFDDEEFPK
jgi:hypothetical protein